MFLSLFTQERFVEIYSSVASTGSTSETVVIRRVEGLASRAESTLGQRNMGGVDEAQDAIVGDRHVHRWDGCHWGVANGRGSDDGVHRRQRSDDG